MKILMPFSLDEQKFCQGCGSNEKCVIYEGTSTCQCPAGSKRGRQCKEGDYLDVLTYILYYINYTVIMNHVTGAFLE